MWTSEALWRKARPPSQPTGLAQDLKMLAPKAGGVCTNLGVDFKLGKTARRTSAKKRKAKGKKKVARIEVVTKWVRRGKHRMTSIAKTGMKPALAYDAPVVGISDREWSDFQVAMLKTKTFAHRGCSRKLRLAMLGDDAVDVAIAPAFQYAKMLWQAGTCANPVANMKEMLDLYARCAAESGNAPVFKKCRGPIAKARHALERIRWQACSATTWRDDRGYEIDLMLTAPRLVMLLLKEGVQRHHERAAACKMFPEEAAEDPDLRATFDIVRKMTTRASK